jgi:hypothetical protein
MGTCWAPSTAVGERINLNHLLPEVGRKLIVDIDHKDISRIRRNAWQKARHPRRSTMKSASSARHHRMTLAAAQSVAQTIIHANPEACQKHQVTERPK